MTIREQLMRDEGLRLTVYTCPAGALSIGYGRNLEARGITREEAMMLLENDIGTIEPGLDNVLPWARTLDDARWGVLVNMAFNLGIRGLLGFKRMLAALKHKDYDAAAGHLLDSAYARQVGERAVRLAKQLRTGEWQ